MKKKAFLAALPYTSPVFLGYLFLGIAFGVSLVSKGYSFYLAIFMSVVIYAGSGQFLAIGLLCEGASIVSSAFLTFMINIRHIFYGLSMFDKFENMGIKKPYMIFSLTDETYSLLCRTNAPKDVNKSWFYFFIALLDHSYWILGSTIGAVAGTMLKFNSKGIDFAMTSLFIVIFVEQWETMKKHKPHMIGLIVSTGALILFGKDNFIVISMLFMLLLLVLFRKRIERDYEAVR